MGVELNGTAMAADASGLQILHTPLHALHRPGLLGARGGWRTSRDVSERVDAMRAALGEAGFTVQDSTVSHGLAPLARVHDARYLDFLATAHAEWSALPGATAEVHANVFAMRRHGGGYPRSVEGRAAFHFHDQLAPIGPTTWEAARAAADLAVEAAERVLRGARCAYALCRPPGHHAYADMAGGGTYLNNAAIAAEHLRQRFARVAVLDLDVHHGNGTQDIFWRRADVLFVSLHRDSVDYHPFFAGHADERGEGEGEGYTLNLPLPAGTGDADYLLQLWSALERIDRFAPQALVVSLGLDAHESDPAAGLRLTETGFAGMGRQVASLELPTVLVQEGGYNPAVVGASLVVFLDAWR